MVDVGPAYERAIKYSRPALQALYRATFARHRLDAIVFPTVPVVAMKANEDAGRLENFGLLTQNTRPSANAGIPSMSIPVRLGSTTGLPMSICLDGPEGSDWNGAGEAVWPNACSSCCARGNKRITQAHISIFPVLSVHFINIRYYDPYCLGIE
jgi:Amidase